MNKKELIRQSATKIIAAEGFSKTKIQEIADDAEIAVGTVYIYFKSKDEILDYIFESQHKRINQYSKELDQEDIPPLEKIKKILKISLRGATGQPKSSQGIVSRRAGGSLKTNCKGMKNDSFGVPEIFQKMLNDSKRKGQIRDIDTEIFGSIIFFVGRETAYMLQVKGEKDKYYQAFEELITFIINGIKK